ncbi:MAG: dTDP-glucose 4,6-dehydratase [Gammaproteobacteria bacterium]|nr:dTDP-glucose 4,6-dehydratase [Gammaproteobacteria bacterium]
MSASKTIMVTGGAGFIGSALVRYLFQFTPHSIVNIDKLTYAGSKASLKDIASPRHIFVQIDVCDSEKLQQLFHQYQPKGVIHLAAETHVDRSIKNAFPFVQANIVGTYTLLEAARNYWQKLEAHERAFFRFHQVSTDEVYGPLGDEGEEFTETSRYHPSSPYSASKAAADHLVHAWYATYQLPVIITHSSNNYGPYQYPEKLIPFTIACALQENPIPLYGTGNNVRDWIYVEDHVRALWKVFQSGTIGETYHIGSRSEQTNYQVVKKICTALDTLKPRKNGESYQNLITFVTDRPGHDWRYALDTTKITQTLGWQPQETFESGLCKTVEWYLQNTKWLGIAL